jgi:hypothetical protein
MSGWQRGLALGMIGTWTHFAVHSLVDTLLVNNIHLHLAVLLGLAAYLDRASSVAFTDQRFRIRDHRRGESEKGFVVGT